MKNYELTFVWPNDDWTWTYVEASDFHQAMLMALDKCPLTCRVYGVHFVTVDQLKANQESARRRAGGRNV